jgi:hypothetical protein
MKAAKIYCKELVAHEKFEADYEKKYHDEIEKQRKSKQNRRRN